MKRILLPALLIAPALLVIGSRMTDAAPQSKFIGIYRVDIAQWRDELNSQKHQMIVNGVAIPVSDADWRAATDRLSAMLQTASLTVRPDGTYAMTTPIADIDGSWTITENGLAATPKEVHAKINGPFTNAISLSAFHAVSEGFSQHPSGTGHLCVSILPILYHARLVTAGPPGIDQ